MNQVTEYMDYRAYMRDFYEERKRSSVFSWREFAKLAGFFVVGLFEACVRRQDASESRGGSKGCCGDGPRGVPQRFLFAARGILRRH